MNSDDNKKMVIGVVVLWGGLVVIGLVMTVLGFLIFTGRASGSRFTLPLGAIILIRSVIKVIGLKRQLSFSGDETDGSEKETDEHDS